ncbi:MAG TPA: hypothetical protein VK982_15490 [Bacteroidales bacterium]|nr:hypothetical protein [Bacteroidales bacterium]
MAKIESMSIGEFAIRDFTLENEIKARKRIKIIKYSSITATFILLPNTTFAATSLDQSARQVYSRLLSIGKWIIIIKGAIDTINHSVKGDFDTAKKSFLSYLVVYLILNGLPWAFNEVDKLFSEL